MNNLNHGNETAEKGELLHVMIFCKHFICDYREGKVCVMLVQIYYYNIQLLLVDFQRLGELLEYNSQL
jgi:hypothetical protein